jgi:hypothetical protein
MGYPVHQATLGYRVPEGEGPVHLAVTWWGDMPLGEHLREFLRLSRIEAPLRFGGTAIADTDRKLLAERLRREVVERFEPMVAGEEIARLLALRESAPEAVPPVLRPERRSS